MYDEEVSEPDNTVERTGLWRAFQLEVDWPLNMFKDNNAQTAEIGA